MILLYWILYVALIPICLIVQVINRVFYFPPKIEETNRSAFEKFNLKTLESLDHSYKDVFGSDDAKFTGMWYYCTGSREIIDYLMNNFIDRENYTFIRFGYPKNAFSRDMMSGLQLAIVKALHDNELLEKYKKDVSECLWQATFKTWFPFRFKHENYDRGFFALPPISNGIAFSPLNMLRLGQKTSTGIRAFLFGLFYYLFLIPLLPCLLFGYADRTLFWGRVFMEWSYGTHSDALQYATGIYLKIPFSKYNLKNILKRHKENIDFRALNLSLVKFDKLEYDKLLHDLTAVRLSQKILKDYKKKTYFDLRKFEVKELAEERIYIEKCNDYNHERGYLDRGQVGSNKSDLSICFSGYILKNIKNEV